MVGFQYKYVHILNRFNSKYQHSPSKTHIWQNRFFLITCFCSILCVPLKTKYRNCSFVPNWLSFAILLSHQVSYGREALQVCAVQSGFCLLGSPQGSHQDPLRPKGVQVPDVRHHIHHQRQPAASHDHPQWPATLHVPLLPEDLQVVTQLQEAHEDTQVWALSVCLLFVLHSFVLLYTFCHVLRSFRFLLGESPSKNIVTHLDIKTQMHQSLF